MSIYPEVNKDLWTAIQVAEFLGVSQKTISNWVSKRQIPYIKIGGRIRGPVRFLPDEVMRWVKKNKRDERNPIITLEY